MYFIYKLIIIYSLNKRFSFDISGNYGVILFNKIEVRG